MITPTVVYVVTVVLPDERARRRVYCTAAAGIKAVERARAANRPATLIRAKLTPLVIL